MGWCATASDTRTEVSNTASPHQSVTCHSLLHAAQMLDAFFPVLADRFHNVEVSLWNALCTRIPPTSLDSGRSSPDGAQTPRAFVISNSSRPQSVAGTKRLGEYDAPKFVEFESHDVSMAYYNGNGKWNWQNLGI